MQSTWKTLLQRGHTVGNRHLKSFLMSLIIREMQIKTTMRYHLTLVRIAVINKSTNNRCWWGCGKKGILMHCWYECILVWPLRKTVWSFLKKLKMEPPYDPVIPILSICMKKSNTLIWKNIWTPMFIAELFTIAKPSAHR